jgi:ribonucleoside-diphosphate reductase beta chain
MIDTQQAIANSTDVKYVVKRTGERETFQTEKIKHAIIKAMNSAGTADEDLAEKVSHTISRKLFRGVRKSITPTVDEIHDMVENHLMDAGLNVVAKEYILYRSKHKPDIFKKRIALKPYEYPNLVEYVDAIRHSYWVHTEFNFTSDIQDFKVHLNEAERTAVQRAMLAISQIEIAVKTFWGDIYKKLPKPEIGAVGMTFAESEVRHADAYSNLIQVLGLNSEFENLLEVPAIRRRIKYLEKSISNTKAIENQDYFESVILFSMFVENVSLFSQFLVIMSFNKHKNMLKGMSNAVEATSKEENIHAEFGFDLVNLIKQENPEWWTEDLVEDIVDATLDAYDAESDIVEWMFEKGDLDFLTKEQTLEFIKDRFNRSLKAIGINEVFKVDQRLLETTEWFDDEILTTKHTDFFNKRSINYSKKQKSITSNDLF